MTILYKGIKLIVNERGFRLPQGLKYYQYEDLDRLVELLIKKAL